MSEPVELGVMTEMEIDGDKGFGYREPTVEEVIEWLAATDVDPYAVAATILVLRHPDFERQRTEYEKLIEPLRAAIAADDIGRVRDLLELKASDE